METLQQQDIHEQQHERRRAGWASSMGVAALAVAVASGLRLVAMALGVDVRVDTGSGPYDVGLVAVVAASAIGALCGVLVLQVALRRSARGRRWWTIGALACLVLSLTSPLQATTTAAWLVLTLLHLATGAVVILGLRRVSA